MAHQLQGNEPNYCKHATVYVYVEAPPLPLFRYISKLVRCKMYMYLISFRGSSVALLGRRR